MEDQELRDQLAQLHRKLEEATRNEPLDRDVLSHVMTDIVKLSSGQVLHPDQEENLKEQLRHQASDFELRHPKLASITQEIMDVLSRLGI